MDQVGALDSWFLHAEDTRTPAHVGCLLTLRPPHGRRLSVANVRDTLEQRLHLAPRLRQRLLGVPLGLAAPFWVDDPDFDLEFHVRGLTLERSSGPAALWAAVADLHARQLDRERPLWSMHLVDGLSGGRQALYARVHHAMLDGSAALRVLSELLDVSSEPEPIAPPDEVWQPQPLPSAVDVAAAAAASLAGRALAFGRVPGTLAHLRDVPGLAGLVPTGVPSDGPSNPPSPLNRPITAHRTLAPVTLARADVDRAATTLGLTLNGVVLAVCAGALRDWLLDHDGLPDEPIVAAVPVSLREADEGEPGSELGNELGLMTVPLPTHIADPLARAEAVQAETLAAQERLAAAPRSLLADVAALPPPIAVGPLASVVLRRLASQPPCAVVVSNVRGPAEPRFFAGAAVEEIVPLTGVSDVTGALAVAVLTYADRVHVGVVACRELVPDAAGVPARLESALTDLLAALPT